MKQITSGRGRTSCSGGLLRRAPDEAAGFLEDAQDRVRDDAEHQVRDQAARVRLPRVPRRAGGPPEELGAVPAGEGETLADLVGFAKART